MRSEQTEDSPSPQLADARDPESNSPEHHLAPSSHEEVKDEVVHGEEDAAAASCDVSPDVQRLLLSARIDNLKTQVSGPY